ncbi:terminase gpA endonuclease subunit [Elstera sp.]|jgi:phage terminase large subunit GpA-like protein|uniref:terminase gpA endonuclease subunit n=1 Tax=Elstera sp. TaxID=1916664 RepID=UPI0037BF7DD1
MQPITYASPAHVRAGLAWLIAPPQAITVPAAAEKVRMLDNPAGGYSGPWRNAMAPYLMGPMASLDDPAYGETIFVGPGQSGKTEIGLNWLTKSVAFDPADMLIVLDEKDQVEDFAVRRMQRLVNSTRAVFDRLEKNSKFQYEFRGMLATLLWATGSKAASKNAPRVWMSERDSMVDDLDGEGDPVDLFQKRVATFGAAGKLFVESSPKKPVKRSNGQARLNLESRHHAPPTTGILARYMRGTMRRFYWPCPHCGEWHTPMKEDFYIEPESRASDEVIACGLVCPHCKEIILETDKAGMLARAGEADNYGWVAWGETIDAAGRVSGRAPRSPIDSFWLSGFQSAFVTWQALARKQLAAEEDFERSGDENALKTYHQLDLAEIYESKLESDGEILDEIALQARAEDYPLKIVPTNARLVTAAVDVQGKSFEVMVKAWGAGEESWIIDRYAIEVTGDRSVSPASYPEDWDLLGPIWTRAYPLATNPERGLVPACVVIDTGGEDGVSTNAKAFRAKMRERGFSDRRVMLIKGDHGKNLPLIRPSNPDKRLSMQRVAGGDTRVLLLNVDKLKGIVYGRLKRKTPGPNYIHLSRHLSPKVFLELTAEQFVGGKWHQVRVRNESFDLEGYNLAGLDQVLGGKPGLAELPAWLSAFETDVTDEVPPLPPPRPKASGVPLRRTVQSSWMQRGGGRAGARPY